VALFILLFFVIGASTTVNKDPKLIAARHPGIRKLTVADTDGTVNDFTQTLPSLYGTFERIVIDSTGTDTSYKVYLRDENGIEIFSKTDCTSASEPYSFAISVVDTGSAYHPSVPVAGQCALELADGDDASLTAISIYLYYRENEK
jgi:hypothetical protein